MITIEPTFNLRENPEFPHKIAVKSVDIDTFAEELLGKLSAKQKLVVSGRFGVSGREPLTLEAIGKSLNITRERVRQIEADGLNLLKNSEKSIDLSALVEATKEILAEKGDIAEDKTLSKDVFQKFFGKTAQSGRETYLMELIFSVAGFKKLKGNKEIKEAWASNGFDQKKFRSVVSAAEKIFDETKKLYSEEDILKKIDNQEIFGGENRIQPEVVLNYLSLSQKFGKNIFGDWGKAKWPLIRPRGVREKATLVLLSRKKPLHFREISQSIEKMGLSAKKVHPQTVHNELIRDKRFVLIGRGTYALREWGYEEGTVKEIIVSLIQKSGGPVKKEDIVKHVLKKRKVKKATIDVNLSDRKIFVKEKDGYALRNTK
ncbi:MAG: sigma factor-like helix-turn-helix DNA-binding protein [Candidatus Moranbacteria bacterium]|nr:sigma factor-like helix-turn-helix DNA-binding protein [Candidatus Moranbacteria bacterium]